MNAITLNSLGQNGSQIVGPALGGAAIAIWGIGASFALQSVLMGLGLLVLVPLRIPRTEARRQQRRIRAEIGEGFGFILRRADIRALFILLLGSALIMMGPWQALLLKIAKEELGSGPFSASMLFAAMGSGMICSSLLLASRPRIPNAGGWFATTLVTGGLLAVGIGLSNVYWLTFGFMLLSGLNAGFFINLNLTLIQSHTPNAVMGRVMSIYAFVQMGGSPLGSLLAGGGAEVVGAVRMVRALRRCDGSAGRSLPRHATGSATHALGTWRRLTARWCSREARRPCSRCADAALERHNEKVLGLSAEAPPPRGVRRRGRSRRSRRLRPRRTWSGTRRRRPGTA